MTDAEQKDNRLIRLLPNFITYRSRTAPWLLERRSADAFILSTVCMAVFTDVFLYGMIVPVMPYALQSKAHVPSGDVQYWVSILIAVYGAALLAFSPVCGWIADHTSSRRSSLVVGLGALTGATVMLNVGSSAAVLVAARLLQGISAAIVWVVGLALLADTVDSAHVAQHMGYVGLSMSMGILLAPLLGGVVFDRGGYNAVYAMAYALIGLDIILRLLMIEKKVAARWLAAPPGIIEIPLSNLPQQTPPPPPPPTNSPNPKPPLRARLPPILTLLASRRLLASLYGVLVQATLMTAFDGVLTNHVRTTFHWSATAAGLLFLPLTLPALAAPYVGRAADRHGPRWLAVAGFVAAAPAYVLLRCVGGDGGAKGPVVLCVLLAAVGVALTLMMTPLMAEITAVVEAKATATAPASAGDVEAQRPRHRARPFTAQNAYAQAYGLFNMAFAGGCLVGPIWAGFVLERAGWATMGWSLGVLAGTTAVPIALWTGGWVWRGRGRGWRGRGKRAGVDGGNGGAGGVEGVCACAQGVERGTERCRERDGGEGKV